MTDVLGTLMDEHLTIGMVIGLLEASLKCMRGGRRPPQDFFATILDTLQNFADKCHHAKEEEALFPLFKGASIEDAGTVSLLIEEHRKGRALTASLAEAVGRDDDRAITEAASGYVDLMSRHIRKENVVFPTWLRLLSDEAKREMSERFDGIEARSVGAGGRAEYRKKMEMLRKEMPV